MRLLRIEKRYCYNCNKLSSSIVDNPIVNQVYLIFLVAGILTIFNVERVGFLPFVMIPVGAAWMMLYNSQREQLFAQLRERHK